MTNDDEKGKILNSSFSSVVKHLNIPELKYIDFSAEYMPHPDFKSTRKFRNQPSVCTSKLI